MTRKTVWLLLSCLMVAALVLASCKAAEAPGEGKTVTGEVEEKEEGVVVEEKEEVVAVEEEVEMVTDSLGRLVAGSRWFLWKENMSQ